jgi:hypothetical protein
LPWTLHRSFLRKVCAFEEDSDGFKTVTYTEKTTTGAPVVITVEHRREPLVGVRNSASVPVVSKKERFNAFFVSRFSPEVIADDVEILETKLNTYPSFRVSVIEDEFPLINNIDVWPAGCQIASFNGKLIPDQVYPSSTPVIGDISLPNNSNLERRGSPHAS